MATVKEVESFRIILPSLWEIHVWKEDEKYHAHCSELDLTKVAEQRKDAILALKEHMGSVLLCVQSEEETPVEEE